MTRRTFAPLDIEQNTTFLYSEVCYASALLTLLPVAKCVARNKHFIRSLWGIFSFFNRAKFLDKVLGSLLFKHLCYMPLQRWSLNEETYREREHVRKVKLGLDWVFAKSAGVIISVRTLTSVHL